MRGQDDAAGVGGGFAGVGRLPGAECRQPGFQLALRQHVVHWELAAHYFEAGDLFKEKHSIGNIQLEIFEDKLALDAAFERVGGQSLVPEQGGEACFGLSLEPLARSTFVGKRAVAHAGQLADQAEAVAQRCRRT